MQPRHAIADVDEPTPLAAAESKIMTMLDAGELAISYRDAVTTLQ
jgi:hypothetical protein